RWPEQSTTTVVRWAVAARADAGVAAPLVADAQPARKPRASRTAARAVAGRLGEGFMVPPRNAHHTVRRGGPQPPGSRDRTAGVQAVAGWSWVSWQMAAVM